MAPGDGNLSLKLSWLVFSRPLLRVSPCLPQRWTCSHTAGGRGAEGGLWGRELLPSGCGDSLVSAGPGSVWPEGRCSSPQGAAERPAVQPQTQHGQDLHAVGFLLPPGFAQGLRQTVYMQCHSSVPASAHQKEFHSECWRWEDTMSHIYHCSSLSYHTVAAEQQIWHIMSFFLSVLMAQNPSAGLTSLASQWSYCWPSSWVGCCSTCTQVSVETPIQTTWAQIWWNVFMCQWHENIWDPLC